ncbi:beta-glucosidase 18-like [Rutidosis leptorrhynchoides]|uniref:beta-glucosidase 18-like n=1 Tax=Rutidosis leptorrhynchoides TaxID=125765 RepID=UPI003A9A308A
MKTIPLIILLLFFLTSSAQILDQASKNGHKVFKLEDTEEPHVKRSDFPSGFLFGAASSAYQVEGAYLEDGKSLSNWDAFCHSVGCAENGVNGDVADDHYHLFMRDIELMHGLGLKSYRFSISWARILPRGKFGDVNAAGIMFYNKIIDNLILKGIEPFVTIFHNDFPQVLEERHGWLNSEMQEEFVYLAEICFKFFGDRVKYWVTINEPNMFVELAYVLGTFPPSRCSEPFGNCSEGNSDIEPLIAMHNMLLAHGKAAKLYHETFQPTQGGLIGLVAYCYMFEPLTDNELDIEAAKRAFAYNVAWVFDPSIFGHYPEEMRKYLGSKLPSFSSEEKNFMKNSIDFIGINHYSAIYVKDCINSSCTATGNRAIQGFLDTVVQRNGVPIGELTGLEYLYVVPSGMEKIVNLIKIRYNNKPMFITENGYSSPDVNAQVNEIVNDVKRIEFHTAYLASLANSIRDGADVRGYFIWSLMDSYEWNVGYDARFGLYYVDRKTLTRIPKLSAAWYKNFLADNNVVVDIDASRHKRSIGKNVSI